MKIDLSQFRDAYLQESAEHLTAMESGLLDLRRAPGDVELLNAIFRSAHSIKGGAGTFGLAQVIRLTHALENLLDRLRSLEIPADDSVIDVLLESVDVLRALLDADPAQPLSGEAMSLIEQIEAISPPVAETVGTLSAPILSAPILSAPIRSAPIPSAPVQSTYQVEFRPAPELFASGCNPLLLIRNLSALGTVNACKLDLTKLPKLKDLDPASCYLSWTVELLTEAGEAEIREVFEFVEHLAEIRIGLIEDGATGEPGTELQTLQPVQQMQKVAHPQMEVARAASLACESEEPPGLQANGDASVVSGMANGTANRTASKTASMKNSDSNTIRVPTEKVDRLVDLVGELVIAHVMTEQMVDNFTPERLPQLRQAVEAMERSMRELHEQVMAIRMLPVGTLFGRYTRTVYDIAKSTGKQMHLELAGEETEIDKSMLDLLGDPLTHLIRNAADHGIESAEQRSASGKEAQGTIRLSACHRGGKIAIEISDDGAGIDPVRVRAKAIERGLISAESQLSEEQVRMLIFEPGFSTRDEVSDLSGRGVGMDVVRRNIEQLHGTVALSSKVGLGSTVTIELPLTLAILEGLLVRVQDRTLVLPLLSVIETVSSASGQITRIAEQGESISVRGESVPVLRLSRFLGLAPAVEHKQLVGDVVSGQAARPRSLIVIVEAGAKKIGLVVDELLGQQQVVLKSLEQHLHKVDGLMGATILGDGSAAPVIDVEALAKLNLFSLQAPIQAILPAQLLAMRGDSAIQPSSARAGRVATLQ